jgi:hypothetical protein
MVSLLDRLSLPIINTSAPSPPVTLLFVPPKYSKSSPVPASMLRFLAEADKSDIDSQADNADIDSQVDNADIDSQEDNTDINTDINTDVNVNVDTSKQYQNQDGTVFTSCVYPAAPSVSANESKEDIYSTSLLTCALSR